jgi:hypothetical protein
MSEVVRLPEPVYEELTEEADRMDMSRGAVVHLWMEAYYE